MPVLNYLGKGVRETVYPYRTVMVFGAELGTPDDVPLNDPLAIVDPVTTLDLSTITPNHEAIVALTNISSPPSSTSISHKWIRDRDGQFLATGSSFWFGSYSLVRLFSYIGYVAPEITENGAYHVVIEADGQIQSIPFTVTGCTMGVVTPGSTWPWPLSEVQAWFENFYNTVLQWFWTEVQLIVNALTPLINNVQGWLDTWSHWVVEQVTGGLAQVWSWIQGVIDPILTGVRGALYVVWDWLTTATSSVLYNIYYFYDQVTNWVAKWVDWLGASTYFYFQALCSYLHTLATDIGSRVSSINQWFSNEFIDPFLDWLIQFPAKFWEAGRNFIVDQWQLLWGFWSRDWNWLKLLTGMVTAFTVGAIVASGAAIGAAVISAVRWIGGALLSNSGAIGGWFATIFSRLGGWIIAGMPAIGSWFGQIFPAIGKWFLSRMIPLLGAGGIITLETTGQLERIIATYVTPAITGVFDWAERMGPVSPQSGKSMSTGITRLAEFTVSGLAAMTLAGEFLSPLKHVGLGHISAIIYDLINYKTLTAAFMGVLAFVYIKQPLTYYYQRIARPNIPDERSLGIMAEQYVISQGEYQDTMAWHGLPDTWISKLEQTLHRPMTPYMLRNLAEAGELGDELLDHALRQAGYDAVSMPAIKRMMQRIATNALQAVAASSALNRYKEGLDTEIDLRGNLSALGVAPELFERYVFAADLMYFYDYQLDLIAYYRDAYHRRDIEEPAFRRGLTEAGLLPQRLGLVIDRERIKRIPVPRPVEPPEVKIAEDTIRDRRAKNLITHAEEVELLLKLGRELPYASAIADNDDVKLAEKQPTKPMPPTPYYETEEGKVRVDTVRRLRRQRQITAEDEIKSLTELEMPASMAQAIAENDELRLRKETEAE